MNTDIWQEPKIIAWTGILLDSYERLLGCSLIPRKGTPLEQSRSLYEAPSVVVSHDTEADPIFNYGNRSALYLWEVSWTDFIRTPSRSTVKEEDGLGTEEREKMLKQVLERGYISDYKGVRISWTGQQFRIENVTVWNVTDDEGKYCGQAATFSEWVFLEGFSKITPRF